MLNTKPLLKDFLPFQLQLEFRQFLEAHRSAKRFRPEVQQQTDPYKTLQAMRSFTLSVFRKGHMLWGREELKGKRQAKELKVLPHQGFGKRGQLSRFRRWLEERQPGSECSAKRTSTFTQLLAACAIVFDIRSTARALARKVNQAAWDFTLSVCCRVRHTNSRACNFLVRLSCSAPLLTTHSIRSPRSGQWAGRHRKCYHLEDKPNSAGLGSTRSSCPDRLDPITVQNSIAAASGKYLEFDHVCPGMLPGTPDVIGQHGPSSGL